MKPVKTNGILIKFDLIEADLTKGNNKIKVNFDWEMISNQPVILKEVRLNIRYH